MISHWKLALFSGAVVWLLHSADKRKNPPEPRPSDRAMAGYRAFQWGKEPDKVLEVERPEPKGDMFKLGEIAQINYLASKDEGKDTVEAEYYHRFEGELPVLAADEDGKLFVIGGSYDIEPRGIVG